MTPDERIAHLEAHCADLERRLATVEQYEHILRLKRFGCGENMARLVLILRDAADFKTMYQLNDELPVIARNGPDGIIKTMVYRIRQWLGADAIENRWARGYRMTDAGRERLAAHLAIG